MCGVLLSSLLGLWSGDKRRVWRLPRAWPYASSTLCKHSEGRRAICSQLVCRIKKPRAYRTTPSVQQMRSPLVHRASKRPRRSRRINTVFPCEWVPIRRKKTHLWVQTPDPIPSSPFHPQIPLLCLRYFIYLFIYLGVSQSKSTECEKR